MDKSTLSNYGWVVCVILVLAIMISLATPFGSVIRNGVEKTVTNFKDDAEGVLDNMGGATGFGDLDSGWDDNIAVPGLYNKRTHALKKTWNELIDANLIKAAGNEIEMVSTSLDGDLVLPDTVTVIKELAFANCDSINSVIFLNNEITVKDYAFYKAAVNTVKIPANAHVENNAFNLTSGSTVELEEGRTTITSGMFKNSRFSSVKIPVSVTLIEGAAFEDAVKTGVIYYGGSYEQWNAIEKQGSWDLALGQDVGTEYEVRSQDGLSLLVFVTKRYDTPPIASVDPGLYEANSYNIKKTWNELIDEGLVNVSGDTVTSVNKSLEGDLVLSNKVAVIDKLAFANCSAINKITFLNSKVTIKNCAFQEATINTIQIPAKAIVEAGAFNMTSGSLIELESGRTVVTEGMFKNSRFSTVKIPVSVTLIEAAAFEDAISTKTIRYDGTIAQWVNIAKWTGWNVELAASFTYSYLVSAQGASQTFMASMRPAKLP